MQKLVIFFIFAAVLLSSGCGTKNTKGKIEAMGTLEAKYVTVSSKTVGEVKKFAFEEGDKIKTGDTLLVIDTEGAEIQVRNAQAAVDLTKAQLLILQNGSRKEDIGVISAQLEQSRINFNLAKKDKERYELLVANGTITRRQYEDVLSRYEIAGQLVKSAQDNLQKINNIARPEEILQAKARVDQSVAVLDAAKKQLRDATVVSPIDGILVKKFVERGETVSMLSNLVKISNLSIIELMLYVSETELARVKLGAKVEVTIDSFKDKSFIGKVVYISPESEFTPKNIQTKDERTKLVFGVKVEIPNPGMELKTGLPADANIYE